LVSVFDADVCKFQGVPLDKNGYVAKVMENVVSSSSKTEDLQVAEPKNILMAVFGIQNYSSICHG